VSNALAIAGVTAVLKDLLDGGLIDHNVTSTMGQGVIVSALAPDAIQVGTDQTRRLNLFLHQATPNAAWRNINYPSRNAAGDRIRNPPLALDLHYLLTAYGTLDLEAEVLLGYAMQVLHETPVLARAAIRKALNPPVPPVTGSLLPTVYQALQASELADQIEQIKITPAVMNTEELSKLWTAFQTHYRPTAPYQVTVVLIESRKAARTPLPVLMRGRDPVTGGEIGVDVHASIAPPAFPEIQSIKLPHSRLAAQLGDAVELDGHDLDGTDHTLLLTNLRLGVSNTITPATSANAAAVTFPLPNDAAALTDYPAGTYTAALQLKWGGDPNPRVTNQLPLSIAPTVTVLTPAPIKIAADGSVTIQVSCTPDLLPEQRVFLILSSHEAPIDKFDPKMPRFVFRNLAPGPYWVRLRVDGVDSPLVDYEASPPAFIAPQITVQP
jgi:hypothetical protein